MRGVLCKHTLGRDYASGRGELLPGTGVAHSRTIISESNIIHRNSTVTERGVVGVSDVEKCRIVVCPVVYRLGIDHLERIPTGFVLCLSGYSESSQSDGSDRRESCSTSKHIVDVFLCVYEMVRMRELRK